MTESNNVEELKRLIQLEREKQARLEEETQAMDNDLILAQKQNSSLISRISQVQQEQNQIQAQLDKQKAISFEENNSEYINSIESALTDIQYADMSLGDLYRLQTIFLNELNRVNTSITKKTSK